LNARSMMNDNDKEKSPSAPSSQASVQACLDQVRAEARKIVETARAEVAQVRSETLEALKRKAQSLEERAVAIEAVRKQLDEDSEALERRYRELEKAAFEEARKKGREEGIRAGRAEGLRTGREEAVAIVERKNVEEIARRTKEACETAVAPIRKLVQEMRGTRQALLKNWEENILQICAAIAYQAIMREPEILHDAPLDLLREALELAMNCATLKIRMNPRDVENLNEQIQAILEETGNLAKSEVISDSKITRGGCLVETSLGVVDERLESRLERIVAELSE
jgi:flagellar assembly protein FliH